MQAIWCRFRYGATIFYYVPAPDKRGALYRDWLVMGLCRPFFKRVVFHWHATSMAKWLETCTTIRTRALTFYFLGRVDLSIVPSEHNRLIAEKLWPRRIAVVANGIPDPCPDFDSRVLPRRRSRLAAREKLLAGQQLSESERAETGGEPHIIRALFLAHCTREKGLFDAVQATLLANEKLKAQGSPLALRLIVAGVFPNRDEKAEFDRLRDTATGGEAIHYAGFVQGPQKTQALIEADVLCFPSHWENQPVSVIEALAFGLPTVITRLASVQEMLPNGCAGVADLQAPEQLASATLQLAGYEDFTLLRRHFVSHFTLPIYSSNLANALHQLEIQESPPSPNKIQPLVAT
jgi:glycosyltransferase involved in cell wall biosynthesis